MTRVVNLRKERYDVYIGRPGKGQDGAFGNPFPLRPGASDKEREDCLDKYRQFFHTRVTQDPHFRQKVLGLRDKVLGCFCKPKLCHGDVIAQWLDSQQSS